MGMEIRAPERKIMFSTPVLPPNLEEIRIDSLRVGDADVDLILKRHGRDVSIEALRKEGDLEIVKSI